MKIVDITPEQAAEKIAAIVAARRRAAKGRKWPVETGRRQASVNAQIAIRNESA